MAVIDGNEFDALTHTFQTAVKERKIIKVIGVGGGGSNAVTYMHNQGIHHVNFAICNTDYQALQKSTVVEKIQLGAQHTQGLGAGGNPESGKVAAEETREQIEKLFEDGTQMVFITAGMGGGTGTGAAPVVARLAKERGILTVAVVTLPFNFEGRNKMKTALNGLDEIKQHCDSLMVIENQKIVALYPNLKREEAFNQSDNILLTAAKSIAEIVTLSYTTNMDFNDVKTALEDGGTAVMGKGIAEGEGRADKVLKQALEAPLLITNSIEGASHVILSFVTGDDDIIMNEMEYISESIQQIAGQETNIKFGNVIDSSLPPNQLNLTVVSSGFKLNFLNSFIENYRAKLDPAKYTLSPEAAAPPVAAPVTEAAPITQTPTVAPVFAEEVAPAAAPAPALEPQVALKPKPEVTPVITDISGQQLLSMEPVEETAEDFQKPEGLDLTPKERLARLMARASNNKQATEINPARYETSPLQRQSKSTESPKPSEPTNQHQPSQLKADDQGNMHRDNRLFKYKVD